MNPINVVEYYGVRFPIYRDECGYWTPRVWAYYDDEDSLIRAIEHIMAAAFIA